MYTFIAVFIYASIELLFCVLANSPLIDLFMMSLEEPICMVRRNVLCARTLGYICPRRIVSHTASLRCLVFATKRRTH